MKFLGQPHIMRQLEIYLPYLATHLDEGMNFFVSGPSGWGKTRLSLLCCNYLSMGTNFQYALCNPDTPIQVDPRYRVHFFDEVHLLTHPEFLYPIMDAHQHIIFLATNESEAVSEPLINRCTPLTFEPYSAEDLIAISRDYYKFEVSDEFLAKVVEAGVRNPRIIAGLCKRLTMYTRQYGIPENVEEVIDEFFGIKDGIDILGQRYLEFLTRIGGTASLDTLAAGLHASKSLLLYQIEPVLLYKNLVRITSKGRILL